MSKLPTHLSALLIRFCA